MKIRKTDLKRAIDVMAGGFFDLVARGEVAKLRLDDVVRRLNAIDQRLDRLEAKWSPSDPAEQAAWKDDLRKEVHFEKAATGEIKINGGLA